MAGCALHRVTSSRRPADYKGCGHSNHSYSEFSSHHQCGFFVSRGEGSGFKKFKKFKKFKGARGEGFNFQFSIFPLGASGAGTIVCCTSNYSLSSQRLQFVFRRGIRALCHQVGMSNLECQMSNRRAQPILTSLTFVTTRPFESKLSWRSLLQKFNFQLLIFNFLPLLTLQRYDISIAVHECFGNYFSKMYLIPSFSCFYILRFIKVVKMLSIVICQNRFLLVKNRHYIINIIYLYIVSKMTNPILILTNDN